MGVQIIIDGENGAIAAQELLTFVRVIQGAGVKSDAGPSPAQKAMNDAPKPKPEATETATDATKSAETAQQPAPEPEKQPEEKQPEAANDDVSSRRKSRSKKKDEPAAAAEAAPAAAPAAEQPAFNPPPGINDVLSENEAAPKEVQEKAKAMMDELAPKEGEKASMNYCRATLLYLATVKGMDAGRKIFEGMGVQGLKALPPEKLDVFITEAKKALA